MLIRQNLKRLSAVILTSASTSGCLIAPAPSNVPAYKVWMYQICIPISENEDARSASLVASRRPTARTTTGQPVYFGAVQSTLTGADGTVFIVPESSGIDSNKKYYLFPLNMRVKDEWTSWLSPAQLDYKYPVSMDRFKRFTPLDPSEIPSAPKIRWVYDYGKTYENKWSKTDIPPC